MGRESRVREKANAAKKVHQELPADQGLPGYPERLVMQPVFPDGDPRNAVPIGGGHGRYRVTFTLMRPNYAPAGEHEFSLEPDVLGDSHLAISSPALSFPPGSPSFDAIKLYATTDDGKFVFVGRKNKGGFLGQVETEIEANDFRDAEEKAHRALVPTLSNWSAQLDIPFTIWRVLVLSLETGARQLSAQTPFDVETFGLIGEAKLTKEFQAFAGLYREAALSGSPVYQFLCFYKIVEGIRQRRGRLAEDAKAHGEAPAARPPERVPAKPEEFDPWLNAILLHRKWGPMAFEAIFIDEAKGRKFNDVIDKELTDLRNDIAHALSDSTGVLNVSTDDLLHVARVNHWLPLMKCIARRMLKNEFHGEYLPFLKEDGTIGPPTSTAAATK